MNILDTKTRLTGLPSCLFPFVRSIPQLKRLYESRRKLKTTRKAPLKTLPSNSYETFVSFHTYDCPDVMRCNGTLSSDLWVAFARARCLVLPISTSFVWDVRFRGFYIDVY